MDDTERKRIKPQLLKCAEENENKGTFTGYVIVSSVCRAAVERIEELEKQVKDLEWQLQEVAKDNDYYQAENKRLEQQIEKMKCCGNCKHRDDMTSYCEKHKEEIYIFMVDSKCKDWEFGN